MLDRIKSELTQEESADSVALSFLSLGAAARYLRGYGDDRKAARNLLATFRYRRDIGVNNLGTDVSTCGTVWSEMSKRSMFIGSITDGQVPPSPVLILRKRGEAFDKADFEEYRQAFFYTLDVTAKLADNGIVGEGIDSQKGQWVIVMDMRGYSSKNSPPIGVSMETMRIFQNHFPERAKKIVILDAPRAFGFLWRMISPFIDKVTRDKFLFVERDGNNDDKLKELLGEEVSKCIEVDLEEGKANSAKIMIEGGFLRAKA